MKQMSQKLWASLYPSLHPSICHFSTESAEREIFCCLFSLPPSRSLPPSLSLSLPLPLSLSLSPSYVSLLVLHGKRRARDLLLSLLSPSLSLSPSLPLSLPPSPSLSLSL